MKKIFTFIVAIIGLSFFNSAIAQQKPQTIKIKTPTVQCKSCKERIENYLMREDGIKKVKVDYKRKETTVTFLPDRTNIENIKTAIANVGYDADNVTANEDSYKKLPTCCKKPE